MKPIQFNLLTIFSTKDSEGIHRCVGEAPVVLRFGAELTVLLFPAPGQSDAAGPGARISNPDLPAVSLVSLVQCSSLLPVALELTLAVELTADSPAALGSTRPRLSSPLPRPAPPLLLLLELHQLTEGRCVSTPCWKLSVKV